MTWGGLNPALTAWRQGINQRFPNRDTTTDGARADKLHGSTSQHQEDADGTVDAFDCDVNFLGSADTDGNATEDRIAEALKRDFEADRRSHLWIHMRKIANEDIGPWRIRDYTGPSPHDKHIHFESEQRYEDDGSPWKFTHTDALLREMDGGDMPTVDDLLDADKIPNDINPGVKGEPGYNPTMSVEWALRYASRAQLALDEARAARKDIAVLTAQIKALTGKDFVDEQAIVSGVLAGLPVDEIVAAIPADIAEQVVQQLAARMAA